MPSKVAAARRGQGSRVAVGSIHPAKVASAKKKSATGSGEVAAAPTCESPMCSAKSVDSKRITAQLSPVARVPVAVSVIVPRAAKESTNDLSTGKLNLPPLWNAWYSGDTEGNNILLRHYPGNKKQVSCPYQDCYCSYDDLMNHNPSCVYATIDDMCEAKQVKRNNLTEGLALMNSMSWYNIKNALLCKHLPLSELEHGPYGMTPPELLHVSGQGLIKYMFDSLSNQIGLGKDRDDIDKLPDHKKTE